MSSLLLASRPAPARIFARRWLQPACACVALALLIFVLPLFIPVHKQPTVSASYMVGYNNGVAIVLVACLSVGVFLWSLSRRERLVLPVPPSRMSARFIAAVVCTSGAVLAIASWCAYRSGMLYLGDAGYIIETAAVKLDTGRALYRQMEFAYGPLLVMPTVWLARLLHLSARAAYYVLYPVMESASVGLLGWMLNRLPLRNSLRRAALVLFAFGAITPHLGMNYTFFRFGVPLVALFWATRHKGPVRSACALAIAEVLVLLISPELGIAMAVGVVTFALLRAWASGAPWLLAGAMPLAALAAVVFGLGNDYLRMVRQLSHGALNLPVGPFPHILVFLTAVLWLAPRGVGRSVSLHSEEGAQLTSVYAFSLAYLPAALGRCDPLHVFFNGTGMFMLALLDVTASSRNARRLWVAALAVLVLWDGYVNVRVFSRRTEDVVKITLPAVAHSVVVRGFRRFHPAHPVLTSAEPSTAVPPAAEILRATGGESVATPLPIAPGVEDMLRATHQYAPEYYEFRVDVMNPAGEARSVADMNEQRWALLPRNLELPGPQNAAGVRVFQGLPLPYRDRHPAPYQPANVFEENLKDHWTPVQQFPGYTLYRRKG